MEKIPFSGYDFFAYLSSGAVLVATADYVWGLGILGQREVGPTLGIALIILCYVTGQIVAHFSSWLLEYAVVKTILKKPTALLLGAKSYWKAFAWVFPNYYRSLPINVQHRIREQARVRQCSPEGEGFFLHAYAVATSANEHLQARLDDFRNQYGFARNMSFAFFVAAVAIYIAYKVGLHPVRLRWAILATVAGASLFYRYLKFFRQYSYELFLRYAELPLVVTDK